MLVAHLLRKYVPSEWGGTETAVLRLVNGLRTHGVDSDIWCPRTEQSQGVDAFAAEGHRVQRFRAFVPVARISEAQRRQLVALGGNLMSFHLLWALLRQPGLGAIHSHALNRLAGIGLFAARRRKLPFVVTIHGGVLDLPASAREQLAKPLEGGLEWGKIFGLILQSRRILEKADAVLTCNTREADLLRAKCPRQRVITQPHSVPTAIYATDQRAVALRAFPCLAGRDVVLTVARIDPIKNQAWLVEQAPRILRRFPRALFVFAGAGTHANYEASFRAKVTALGLADNVLCTGGIAPGSDVLVGLLQCARLLLLPSTSETFGLVILEAWAAGTAVVCSRTSGAQSLVTHRENGWLHDIDDGAQFEAAVTEALDNPDLTTALAAAGHRLARRDYDERVLAGRVKELYAALAAEKGAQ